MVRGTLILGFIIFLSASPCYAQVHYEENRPWEQKANEGPDSEVPGWYYNLGLSGLRVELIKDAPKQLLVRYVFPGSPAYRRVIPGDRIIGAAKKRFKTEHKNGYGMDVFGPTGPILDFARALETCQQRSKRGKLSLIILREGKEKKIDLKIKGGYGTFDKKYPEDCKKSSRIVEELCGYLVTVQGKDGSWGIAPHNTFAPLALLATGKKKYFPAVRKNVEFHARSTRAKDDSWLINWRYMAAAIVMSEYYLATKEKWVQKELQEVYDFLTTTQYMDLSQVNPKVKESHPDAYPKDGMDSHGGWGHNPGFEGYGPISMITGQGALAFALMNRGWIKVDQKRHEAAYAFLARSTGETGYVWYKDSAASPTDWADMGRTGAAGIANALSPFKGRAYKERALLHARVIGQHPESFPDTHGSPIMGMGYTALAANVDPKSFRRLMDESRWWFVLAQCNDGTFYYQPNRDNAGYGSDSRLSASAVTAFILQIPKKNLHVTGKPTRK